MLKKGSIIPYILILIVAIFLARWFYNKNATYPTKLTQDTAASIDKYPNSQAWKVENKKGLCAFSAQKCSLSSKISFSTQDEWSTVYNYHVKYLPTVGWKSNTQVFTSTPTGVLFTNEAKCELELSPQKKGFFQFFAPVKDQFLMNITCPV